jgi:exosortase D (VPLPA-CTERM-specific)
VTVQAHRTTYAGSSPALERTGFPLLILLVAAPLPAFWYGFENLAGAWSLPEFRLKGFVPLLCLVLFLQAMRSVPLDGAGTGARWPGTFIIGCALILTLLGNVAQVSHVVYLGIILYVAGAVIVLFGLRGSLAFWAPVACLTLMLPVPMFIYKAVHGLLVSITSDIALVSLWTASISALVEGDFIEFEGLSMRLKDATGGLLNFLPIMLVFFFYATFYRGPLWLRLMPLLLTAPVLVLISALRLVVIGLIASSKGAPAAERFVGLSDGWSFFALATGVVFGLTVGIGRLTRVNRRRASGFDLDVGGMVSQIGRFARIGRSGALATSAVLAVLASSLVLAAPGWSSAAVERESLNRFPPEIAGWSGSKSGLSPGIERTLNSTDYLSMDYFHREEAAPINLWIAYYASQEPTKRVHSPEACLPGEGWNFLSRGIVTLPFGGRDGSGIPANRAVIRKGETTALMYYWYEGRGRRTARDALARVESMVDGLLIRRTDGALVRFVTMIGPDESEAEAEARLQRLIAVTEGFLPRFIPNRTAGAVVEQ